MCGAKIMENKLLISFCFLRSSGSNIEFSNRYRFDSGRYDICYTVRNDKAPCPLEIPEIWIAGGYTSIEARARGSPRLCVTRRLVPIYDAET